MEILILKDGKTAEDKSGNKYLIENLVIVKKGENKVNYPVKSDFFKTACPPHTEHRCQILENGNINIF